MRTKFLTLLTAVGLLFSLPAKADPKLGKEYTEIKSSAVQSNNEILEFFSFYCPHCYDFTINWKIPEKIKAKLPSGVKLTKYHVNFLGRQSDNLTRAWALAMAMGIEDKVETAIYNKARENAFRSMDDIKKLFVETGAIDAATFDATINSFAVNALYNKQIQLDKELNINSTPTFIVNGKYKIENQGIFAFTTNGFIEKFVDTALFLVKKQ